MNRYNIALIPNKPGDEVFTRFSRNNFNDISSGYILSENSLPHITVFQFEYQSINISNIVDNFDKLDIQKTYCPSFTGISLIMLDDPYKEFKDQCAFELGVKKDNDLDLLHNSVVSSMENLGLTACNISRKMYRPHLTLATVSNGKVFDDRASFTLNKELFGKRKFTLRLGIADERWQFNEIIK